MNLAAHPFRALLAISRWMRFSASPPQSQSWLGRTVSRAVQDHTTHQSLVTDRARSMARPARRHGQASGGRPATTKTAVLDAPLQSARPGEQGDLLAASRRPSGTAAWASTPRGQGSFSTRDLSAINRHDLGVPSGSFDRTVGSDAPGPMPEGRRTLTAPVCWFDERD